MIIFGSRRNAGSYLLASVSRSDTPTTLTTSDNADDADDADNADDADDARQY
jgi:hypothetical protein